jgi:transposase
MASSKFAKRRFVARSTVVSKGADLRDRVESVGPARFGVVAVDCAKAQSRWRLADFYGHLLIPPTTVDHRVRDLDHVVERIREVQQQHRLTDLIVALERTGRYHLLLKRVFTAAGWDVRIVDPLATHQYRKPAHGGTKTDDIDLEAIHRALIHGFGLIIPAWPPVYARLQACARHRRDLVAKTSRLRCQIREHLHSLMPGYAELFDDLFLNAIALWVPRRHASALEIREAGVIGLRSASKEAKIRCQNRTLETIVAWAKGAPDGDGESELRQSILIDLLADFEAKRGQIAAVEAQLARLLVQTPYLVLLSMPGVNVVTAAQFAGEMGPITAYASGRAITGRAGIYPSRYQSGPVDQRDGPLVPRGNRRLRLAILQIADTLMRCNDHFRLLATGWHIAGTPKPQIHVRIGGRFCRIAYHMVAGGQTYSHPSSRQRDYILQKLIRFHDHHHIPISETLSTLQLAADGLPSGLRAQEAQPLAEELTRALHKRGAGARRLGEILPSVLARLLPTDLESNPSGESFRAASDRCHVDA